MGVEKGKIKMAAYAQVIEDLDVQREGIRSERFRVEGASKGLAHAVAKGHAYLMHLDKLHEEAKLDNEQRAVVKQHVAILTQELEGLQRDFSGRIAIMAGKVEGIEAAMAVTKRLFDIEDTNVTRHRREEELMAEERQEEAERRSGPDPNLSSDKEEKGPEKGSQAAQEPVTKPPTKPKKAAKKPRKKPSRSPSRKASTKKHKPTPKAK